MIRSRRFLGPIAAVLLLATLVTSCTTGDTPTAPGGSAPLSSAQFSADSARQAELLGLNIPIIGPLLDAVLGLLVCQPEPTAYAEKTIGPNGGTIYVGRHSLVIPRGALSSNVRITAQAPRDNVASVKFQPEGLQFARKATLTLSYSRCDTSNDRSKRVAYTTDDLKILSVLPSRDNLRQDQVAADLDHFSRYAVAW
jgi:hypothetical protein